MTSLVARLFELSREEFAADVWPAHPRFVAGSPARARDLRTALLPPALHDPATFLATHPGRAWQHDTTDAGRYEHERSIPAAEAAVRFASGAMFDVRNLEAWRPEIAAWVAQLGSELGIGAAARASYCHAFASPRGSGVPKHFDNREVVVVQLLGSKRWELAPNDVIANPLAPHVVGGATNALNRHAETALQSAQMAEATTHVMEPGAALFVPRGMWHRTYALEDSLSFSFGFRVPSRLEDVIGHLVHQLASVPGWSAPAYDLSTTRPEGAELTTRAIRAAIERLRGAARGGS